MGRPKTSFGGSTYVLWGGASPDRDEYEFRLIRYTTTADGVKRSFVGCFSEGGNLNWEEYQPMEILKPSIRIPGPLFGLLKEAIGGGR